VKDALTAASWLAVPAACPSSARGHKDATATTPVKNTPVWERISRAKTVTMAESIVDISQARPISVSNTNSHRMSPNC
jgi:hypothetical protein